jgi:hypothetical protein
MEECQYEPAAVTDRGLADDDRHGQEAAMIQQPLGKVELAVFGIPEARSFRVFVR